MKKKDVIFMLVIGFVLLFAGIFVDDYFGRLVANITSIAGGIVLLVTNIMIAVKSK